MIYNNITKTDTYVELSNGENKLIMPASSAIIVDDESGMQSIKTTGSRKTIALVKKGMPEHDYSHDYLTFDIISSGTIVWRHSLDIDAKTISYSLDNGSTWTNITSNSGSSAPSISVNAGDKILFKGTNAEYGTNSGLNNFLRSTATFNIYGNIMSLVYGDNFAGQTSLEGACTFREFFRETNVVSAENLILPATTLTNKCYQSMFNGCKSLTAIPELPAATLASSCYSSMFKGCTSLNYIKCLATDISASYCTNNWVSGVAGTGTFVKAASMDSWTTGASGIPDGWTIENA